MNSKPEPAAPMTRAVFQPGHLLALLAGLLVASGCASRPAPGTEAALTVMTYNIRHGRGMDDRVDLERIARLIHEHRPDLVALQEVDQGVARTQGRDLPGELSRLTGMTVVFGKNIDHQGGDYGNAILSRHPVLASTNLHYRMLREGEQRGLLQTTIDLRGEQITFHSTHLDFRPDPAERLSNVVEIKAATDARPGQLTIVAGDFNDHPGGAVHDALKATFVDAWEQAGRGAGFTHSSTQPKSRIDYVFVRPVNGWKVTRAEVLPSLASDHLPLLVELRRAR
jgi:endonuclease/exonuclease/phosphatase family metal-dependent hydrolase